FSPADITYLKGNAALPDSAQQVLLGWKGPSNASPSTALLRSAQTELGIVTARLEFLEWIRALRSSAEPLTTLQSMQDHVLATLEVGQQQTYSWIAAALKTVLAYCGVTGIRTDVMSQLIDRWLIHWLQ